MKLRVVKKLVISKERLETDALVVNEMNVGESDKLLTLLSRKYGIIRAFSSGSKKINSKKFSASSLLSYANFSLVKTGDTYKIYEAEIINSFFDVGSDITLLSIAQYFCELASKTVPTETYAEDYLRLFLNSLYFLIKEKLNPELIKAITELRLSTVMGYMPMLVACDNCAKYEDDVMYFNLNSGKIFCNNCIENKNECVAVDRTILSAMRHIVFSPFQNIYKFSIPDEKISILSNITEKYIELQTEHSFKTLDFYKQIK